AITSATLNTGGASLVGVIAGDTVTLNSGAATGSFATKTVATGKTVTVAGLALAGADSGNYTVTQPTTTADITDKTLTGRGTTADITAKVLTVTGITASNKIYDATTSATVDVAAATLSGVIAPDVVTLSTAGATGTFSSKNVGTGKTVTITGVTISGADSGNY